MGQEILYCYKCQTRLLGSEFEKGKAFKVGGQASCAACVKDLLASMPEAARSNALKASSSNRIPAAASDSTSKFKVSTTRGAPPPPPAPPKSKNGLILGAVLGGVVLLILVAMAMKSAPGPTARRDPDPPTPIPAPAPGVRPPDPRPAPASPSYAAELREIDEKIKTGLANDEYRSLADYLGSARQRRSSGDWLSEIDLRIPQVEARARRSAQPLRDQAVEANRKGDTAEVKRLRDKIMAWGFPTIVDDFDKALAAPVTPPPPLPPPVDPLPGDARLVYADALGPACRNTSWSGVVDLAATAQVFEGKTSIAFTPQQNAAGVYIALDQPVDPAEYPFVTFALYLPEEHTGAAVALYKEKPEAPVGLDKIGGYPGPRTWKKYVVPVATLNPASKNVTGFVVQIFRTGTQPLLYLDSIAFLKTAPAGAVPPPPPPPPPPSAEPPLVVYDDALAPGWKNWSWSGVWDFAATSPVFEGKRSIAFTPQVESAGIYLHTDQGLDPAEYPFVTFAIYAVEEGVRPGVSLYRNKNISSPLMLDQIAPDLKVREWKRFVLPVDQINPAAERIDGFQIQAYKAGDHPMIYIDSVAFLKSASAGTGSPKTTSRGWAAKASMRDYAGAQRELEEALAALKEEASKKEAAADLELVKLAAQIPADAAKAIEKWTKGLKVKLEVLNGAGEREPVEGAVLSADAVRVTVQRESGPIDVPIAEIASSSLAEIFRARAEKKPTDAKATAAFATFEGDGPGLPKERSEAEVAARRNFWAAEAEYSFPRRRSAAIEKFAAFLAGEPAGYVARLRPYVAARLEAAKDTVFLADDLGGAGTFQQLTSSKLDQAWTSTFDTAPSKARENYVEAEFHAFAGASYRAWVYAGACCLETFEFLLQGSELTAPNPKNSKEPLSCEPGAEAALTAKAPSASLKKWHAQHGGPKEPARWEWIPVALPKYETAGPKKLRILTAQQGFTVGAIVVSAVRRDTPKEPEIKELEKARFGVRKSANTGPVGFVFQEFWENIDGDTVESLIKHPSFAGKPTSIVLRESLDTGPKNNKDRYGSRMRGYLHPPVTGSYVFWIACDDAGELHLSLDDSPARKRLVCSCPFSTNYREWTRNPAQKSAPVVLAAGKRYYFELLQKEGSGDDFVSVGWTLPDGTEEKPIPGSRLSPWNSPAPTPGPPGTVFWRGYNLNGPPTLIDGRRWEGKGAKDLAFSGEGAFENQSVPLTPPTDDARAAMIRTSAFSPDGTAVKVYQMPAGAYLVYFYVWEDNNDEVYDVFLQGKEVLKGHHSGAAGHWDKLGPWPVLLSEGGTLDFKTNGGHANVSGVEIWKSVK